MRFDVKSAIEHGEGGDREAWERARRIVAAQFGQRGRAFTAIAREPAARRRIGASVLDCGGEGHRDPVRSSTWHLRQEVVRCSGAPHPGF